MGNGQDQQDDAINDAERWLNSPRLAATLAAVFAILLYAESLRYDYVYDDVFVAVKDARLQDPYYFLKVWWEPWWTDTASIGETRPLTSLTFWAHSQMHGEWAVAPHLVNVILFGILTYLVATTAARWLRQNWVAWPTGFIVAAHPLHVESVVALVGRAELLAAIFSVAAIRAWLSWRSNLVFARCIMIAMLILLAGQAKETGYLVAAVILISEIAERRKENVAPGNKLGIGVLMGCISVVAVYAIFQRTVVIHKIQNVYQQSFGVIDPLLNPLTISSVSEKNVTPLLLTGKTLELLVFPFNQSPDYSPGTLAPTSDLSHPYVLIGIAALLVWLGLITFAWRAKNLAFGPLAGCLVAWAIPSNALFLIGILFAERMLLMLSIYSIIACVGLFSEFASKYRNLAALACYTIMVICAVFVCFAALNAFIVSGVSFDIYFSIKTIALILLSMSALVFSRKLVDRKRYCISIILIVSVFGFATSCYSPFWQSWNTLVLTTAGRHPENGRFQAALSILLIEHSIRLQRDLYEDAEAAAHRAIEITDYQSSPYVALACIAKHRGDEELADKYLALAADNQESLERFEFALNHFELIGRVPHKPEP